MDLEILKAMLDRGELPRTPWVKQPRKLPLRGRRKNEPYPEHSLSQLRDDPEGNEY